MNQRLPHLALGRSQGGLRHRLAGLCVALCCAANVGFAAVAAEPGPDNSQDPPISYADASDEQLTALAARWDELAVTERRALLSEVKMRMARRQAGTNGVLSIRLTRRYGAVPQGQLRIRLGTGQANAKEFGVGFEQRAGQPQAADSEPSEPTPEASTQQVSDPR
ncbi:MAG: hypothetical protein F4X31_05640 [Gammaproteobacteria bacterium]|nr:hypothetical protein [Gammaproteobacteria bacterium]MYE85708.1 hypothetical protein [Gammaproteobacteria bacterium]